MALVTIFPAPATLCSRSRRQCIVIMHDSSTGEDYHSVIVGNPKSLLRDYSRLFPNCDISVFVLSHYKSSNI